MKNEFLVPVVVSGFALVFTYFGIKLFWPRKCDFCKTRMKRKLGKHDQVIFVCPDCGRIKETNIYPGTDDS